MACPKINTCHKIKTILNTIGLVIMSVSTVWVSVWFWYILIEGKTVIAIEPNRFILIFEVFATTLGVVLACWILWRFITRRSRMKSPEEIQALKDNWRHDPCYDIEDAEGFEDHREELKAYSNAMETLWKVCPLSFHWLTNKGGYRRFIWQACLVEQCALWDETRDCCSLRRAPYD